MHTCAQADCPLTIQQILFDVVTAGLEMVAFIEKNKQERMQKATVF